MASIESLIFDTPFPPATANLVSHLVPALSSTGSRPGTANAALYLILLTELAPLVFWMLPITSDTTVFDTGDRNSPVDAIAVYPGIRSKVFLHHQELLAGGTRPAVVDMLREHYDGESPLHAIASVCIGILFAAQIHAPR